jgi:hypothetical protein
MQGNVTRIGYYGDTLPKLIITIRKEDAYIPFSDGNRIPVPFVINGMQYTAGIRSTKRSGTVMICCDLFDADLKSVRLSDLLFDVGWNTGNSKIRMLFENGVIFCKVPVGE